MVIALADQICSRARSALKTSPIYALRLLSIQKVGDTLVLSGKVESFYQKQLAQELVRTVSASFELRNTIEVV